MTKPNHQQIKKTMDIGSPQFRKRVSEKLPVAIRNMNGLKGFGTPELKMRSHALARKMGINCDATTAGKLQVFTTYLKNAKPEHLKELHDILDSVNHGVRSLRQFEKHKI
jgi:hypothetical protein